MDIAKDLSSPYIHAASRDNFEQLVLDNSETGPVLVNFWLKTSGPCLRLYPLLDQLVHQYEGRLLLVNVDGEAERQILLDYGVTSVPTLKIFRHREVVSTEHGYQNEAQLKYFVGSFIAQPSDQALADAVRQYAAGDAERAYQMLVQAIVDDPDNLRLPLTMAKLLIHQQRPFEAQQILLALPDASQQDTEIAVMLDRLHFLVIADEIESSDEFAIQLAQSPGDLALKMHHAALLIAQEDYAAALDALFEVMDARIDYDNDAARQAVLRVFRILGAAHALVVQFRPRLRNYTH